MRENRRRAAAALGAAPADFVFAAQVHGPVAEVVIRGRPGPRHAAAAGDAVGPARTPWSPPTPGTVLAILVADCVPIVLYDPVAQVLACVHAGWRGTVARVTEAALAAMGSLGARSGRTSSPASAPRSRPDRYQVGEEVAAAARDTLGGDADRRCWRPRDGTGRWLFDLPGAPTARPAHGRGAGRPDPPGRQQHRRATRAVLQPPRGAPVGRFAAGWPRLRARGGSERADPFSYRGL